MANGAMTEDALAARINALSGGAPLPQAATQTIANRLLGPGLADRYGDVIGTRPYSIRDTARDFALGTISGDPLKAEQLKMQVMENYRSELRKEEDQSIQREAAAREQLQGFFQLLQQGKAVPKDLRKDFFKEGLSKIGVEPTSPLFLNILTNYEKFGDIYDALGDPTVQAMADDDPLGAVEQLIAMGHDGGQALQLVKSVQEMKRYSEETQHIIAKAKRLGAITQGDPNAKARAQFVGRLLSQRRTDRLGRPRAITPEEQAQIEDMADRFFPRTAPAGIAQTAPEVAETTPRADSGAATPPSGPAALGISTSVTSTPTTTAAGEVSLPTTTAAPVGIPQQPSPAAASVAQGGGRQKVKRQLTGTVSRVE